MRRLALLLLAAFALPAAGAPDPATQAEAVIAASKAATGGTAWDALQGSYEEGTRADGKLPYKTWLDFGRYGMRVESRRGDKTMMQGFNGRQAWQTAPDGSIRVTEDPATTAEARLTAYVSNNGYFFPARFPAIARYLRQASVGARSFDVIEITPQASRPFEIWFDRATHYATRVIDQQPGGPVTVEAGDYRAIDKIRVPFALTVIGPDGAVLDKGAVTTVKFGPVDAALFDPPKAK